MSRVFSHVIGVEAVNQGKLANGVKNDFNNRLDNTYGERCRVLILDSGYKEGVSVYDVKYIHIFEPPLSKSSLVQAIGRGVRQCGQMGLPFDKKTGWIVDVFVYRSMQIDADKKQTTPVFDLEVTSDPNSKNADIIEKIEKLGMLSATDRLLNKPIIEYKHPDIPDAISVARAELAIP